MVDSLNDILPTAGMIEELLSFDGRESKLRYLKNKSEKNPINVVPLASWLLSRSYPFFQCQPEEVHITELPVLFEFNMAISLSPAILLLLSITITDILAFLSSSCSRRPIGNGGFRGVHVDKSSMAGSRHVACPARCQFQFSSQIQAMHYCKRDKD